MPRGSRCTALQDEIEHCVLTLLSPQELIQIQLRVSRFPRRPAAVRAEDMSASQVDVHGSLVEAHSRGLLGGPVAITIFEEV